MQIDKILQGDVLEVLKTIPDESIDCCITSPPYWGLRDYGTAKWEGGNPECDHRTFDNDLVNAGDLQKGNKGSMRTFKEICKRCGAVRIDNQIGLEKTPEEYVAKMVEVFREVRRVLKKEGTCWLNLGDSYSGSNGNDYKQSIASTNSSNAGGDNENFRGKFKRDDSGLKPKDLVGIPWRVAFALQADGWYLRQDIIWAKPNPMPESVTDRCTKSHEYVFLLTKSQKYFYDNEVIKEPAAYDGRKDTMMKGSVKYKESVVPNQSKHTMAARGHERWQEDEFGNYVRNKRSVWTVCTKPFKEAHFATFPEALIEPMILAGCPKGGLVLDPFGGAGTTAVVAKKQGRHSLLIELNPKYVEIARKRLEKHPVRLDMIKIVECSN